LGCSTCIGTETEKADRFGTYGIALWFVVALVVLALSCACGLYSNVKSNAMLVDTQNSLKAKLDQIEGIGENITQSIQNSTLQVPAGLLDDIEQGFNDIDSNILEISNDVKRSAYKDFYAYFSVAWIILVGIVALLYVATGKGFFFHLTGCMTWFLVLGVCLFLIFMFTFSIALGDVCRELDYSPGLLDLIQNVAQLAYDSLSEGVQSADADLVSTVCNEVQQTCTTQPNLCPCNATTFPQLPQKLVTDIGRVQLTVLACSTQCRNPNLKNMTISIMDAVELHNMVDSVLFSIESLILGFVGPDFKQTLRVIVCNTGPILDPLWAACGLLLFAAGYIGVALLALDRGLCCFKYGDSSVYVAMGDVE